LSWAVERAKILSAYEAAEQTTTRMSVRGK
jgi:hypothetical protein